MKNILVSLDNGNSTTLISDEIAADSFLAAYGLQNASAVISDAGLDSGWIDSAMELLDLLAQACETLGTIPTLP